MTEVKFNFSPERDAEEPLYLDSARPPAPSSRPAMRVGGPGATADRPLQLDFAREPRPKRRGVPLILACALTFVLGAGAGVLVLQPPPALRDTVAGVLASAGIGGAKAAIPAAPARTEPTPEQQTALAAAQAEAAAAPAPPAPPSAISDPPPAAEPAVKPPAKPQAAAKPAASKPHPQRAAAPKKHLAEAKATHTSKPAPKPATKTAAQHAPKKEKAPLDLDALEKSLR